MVRDRNWFFGGAKGSDEPDDSRDWKSAQVSGSECPSTQRSAKGQEPGDKGKRINITADACCSAGCWGTRGRRSWREAAKPGVATSASPYLGKPRRPVDHSST